MLKNQDGSLQINLIILTIINLYNIQLQVYVELINIFRGREERERERRGDNIFIFFTQDSSFLD